MDRHKNCQMTYTSYQTSSFKKIKSTLSTYELPHTSILVPVYSIVLKIPTEPKISIKLSRFTEGGGGGAVATLPHLNFHHCIFPDMYMSMCTVILLHKPHTKDPQVI